MILTKAISKPAGGEKGFTLIELLISIAILGIIVLGLQQVLAITLTARSSTERKQALLADARMTMERMVMFVQASDEITSPVDASGMDVLRLSERVLDLYSNTTHAYDADGDGKLDADNDGDGLVNEDTSTPDPPDYITYRLNKDDAANWKLVEQLPDYSTATLSDYRADTVVCEYVTEFTCKRISTAVVEIKLTLNNNTETVSLTTRARARLIE